MPLINKSARLADGDGATLTATAIIEHLEQSHEPLSWRALSVGMNSLERKNLRNLLRGLVRGGEISQDHQGCYHVMRENELETGELTRKGRQLYFDGTPVADDGEKRGLRLRAGDTVEFRRVDEQVHVLRVVSHSEALVVGELREHARYPYVESLSPEFRGRVSLAEPPAEGGHGDTVAVQVVDQDRRGYVGRVVSVVSKGGGARHAADTLIASYGVPFEWPDEALAEAEALPDALAEGDFPDRRSLLDLPLVTIDGESAKDFDDAVYAQPNDAGWRVVVAIADVAHYVNAKSALDAQALLRGNSVYLPDRVVPMLPEALSNGLCSLRPDEVRLAVVCDMQIAADGEITDFEFFEALIKSRMRLTYSQVQAYLDQNESDIVDPLVCESLDSLNGMLQARLQVRESRGALDFASREASLELDGDKLVALHPVQRLQSHRLIEEAMIAANVCAAQFLEDVGALYRVHESPQADRSEQVRQAFAAAGVRLEHAGLSGKRIQEALAQLQSREDHWIFEILVLRCLPQAIYSPENKGHFGLALDRYMHFTSPIRRYADLVVHRAIKARLAGKRGKNVAGKPDELVAWGEQISATERRAEELGYRVEGWLKCEYVVPRIDENFDGVVMGVTDFGLFVELDGLYVQGLLHVSELGEEYYRYEPATMALVAEGSGRRYGLGDRLTVRLADVEPALGRLDLALTGPQPGVQQQQQAAQNRQQRSGRQHKRRRGGNKGRAGGNRGGNRGGNKNANNR